MKSVRFFVGERTVEARPGETVLDTLLRLKIPIDHSCGGGTCGTCRIFVEAGAEGLEPRNEIESETAADRGFMDDERLACQTLPVDGLRVRKPGDP